jgi:hypothetical protein
MPHENYFMQHSYSATGREAAQLEHSLSVELQQEQRQEGLRAEQLYHVRCLGSAGCWLTL